MTEIEDVKLILRRRHFKRCPYCGGEWKEDWGYSCGHKVSFNICSKCGKHYRIGIYLDAIIEKVKFDKNI
jgi:hypothetical protein